MSIQQLMLGFKRATYFDDFLLDPEAIRNEVLGIERFFRGEDANFPGYAGALSDDLVSRIHQRVEEVIGYKIKPVTDKNMDISARLSTRGQESMARSLVHCDPHPFTAILYLTPDEFVPQGVPYGTRLYETKAQGLNSVLYSKVKNSLKSQWTEEEFVAVADECRANTFNLLYWKMIDYIDFKYNRLCIFEGQNFHSSCPVYYGESREEGRLTVNFFFELAK